MSTLDGLDPLMALEVIDSEIARASLHEYGLQAWPHVFPAVEHVDNWHLGCIDEHLQALTNLEISRLVINMPPRHSKSIHCSVLWPTWVWLDEPSSQWAFFTYDHRLSERDAVRSRDLVRSRWYKKSFGIQWDIRSDMDAKDLYRNTCGGSRVSTTPGSLGAGIDADYLVVDDPHNIGDAGHPTRLEKVCEWFDQTTATRGNNPRAFRRLVVAHRVHERDLSGHLVSSGGNWVHLVLPARWERRRFFLSSSLAEEAGEKNPITNTPVQERDESTRDPRTQDGEPLWKGRFDEPELKALEIDLAAYGTAGQLQQRPSPAQGGIFSQNYFRYAVPSAIQGRAGVLLEVTEDDRKAGKRAAFWTLDELRFFQTIDTAMTKGDRSAYTAIGTFALTPRSDLVIWDIWREKIEVPYQYAAIMALRTGPCRWDEASMKNQPLLDSRSLKVMTWPRSLLFQAVEAKASGIGLIQQAAADGKPYKVLKAGSQDKVERAAPVAGLYYAGKVFHRKGAAFLPALEQELTAFPTGAFADQVDIVAYSGLLVLHDTILRSYLVTDVVSYPGSEVDEFDLSPPEEPADIPHDKEVPVGIRLASGGVATLADEPDNNPWPVG